MTLWNGTNRVDGMEGFEEFAGNAGKQLTSADYYTGLKYNFEWNWPGKLPKTGMELGGVCEVEKRQGFYCAELRLVE